MVIEWRAGRIADPYGRLRYLRRQTGRRPEFGPWTRVASGLILLLIPLQPMRDATIPIANQVSSVSRLPKTETRPVWLVEQGSDHETYSNGLRIDNRFTVETRRRLYGAFDRTRPESDTVQWLSDPAGIVYHATESDVAPLQPDETARLQRIGEALLDYVRRRRSYHFLIDRFGRVYRVVDENDRANHAGHSIWADRQWLYLNLNDSFLGVAFEAHTGQDGESRLEPAQVQSGRALTEMLRYRYTLSEANCVSHAQVSVNPRNMQIGYHTDWANGFPFRDLGLEDNYTLPVAGVALFGFGYSSDLVRASGGRTWVGLESAAASIGEEAVTHAVPPARYARILQNSYRRKMTILYGTTAAEEINDEQQ